MIARIIVPLDHSDVSEAAVPVAAHLAQRRSIPVVLVHILEISHGFMTHLHRGSHVDALAELEDAAQKYLVGVAEGIEGVEVSTIVLQGQPASRLVEYAEELHDSVIVMSSHGRTGFDRLRTGSAVARVVQASPVPVIVVRPKGEDADIKIPEAIRKVLVPLDGSDFAEHALHSVYDFVKSDDLMVRLMRVSELAVYPTTMYGEASYEAVDLYMGAMQDECEAYLKGIAADYEGSPGSVSWEVRDGTAGVAILEAAKDFDADLIAMSTNGRTGFRRFLMGSVAEQVLRESGIPVMMVGPHEVDGEQNGSDS